MTKKYLQGWVKFPTGGDSKFKSANRANGRFGENPKPTVKSGWKKSDVLEFLCPEYVYARGFLIAMDIMRIRMMNNSKQSLSTMNLR